ncbi:Alpha/Beta hydrolase protein [Gamsiella multidivaricata]|uniref:Alpha/Beta hydrolase protein n=1 Tax=Gamsiella multidivaricata TaxID=101098 RepID=UPI00221FD5FB|nr:Alpha/Beta hydrolase protein [Gamsiella multidivaricata]KAI7821384.1 Alpha/Beta hydrolase protein [Gamsiella multidivaricata]
MTTDMMATTQNQNALKYWSPIAYTRFMLYITAYVLRTTVRHLFGRTPKGQKLLEGYTIQVLKLVMGTSVLNIAQSRKMMDVSNAVVHLRNGTFRQKSKDQWATKVKGSGWEGFWIPFKDQSSKEALKRDLQKNPTPADVGTDCDIIMFAIHGGGMVMGDALMFLGNYRAWMKELHTKYNIKAAFLSVEYSMSPEVPYPGALNECVAAYRHLLETQRVDPRRIVMCGDSAGGNLCLATALKIRDEYPHLGLPAGQVLFSPWVMCPQPLKDSPDDYISNRGGRTFMECYTQMLAKVQTSPYAAPIRAQTLAGMPRMLVFIGGIETLRPSIERFVEKATAEGVDLEVHLAEGRSHDYALIEEISGRKIVREADETVARFVASTRDRHIGLAV